MMTSRSDIDDPRGKGGGAGGDEGGAEKLKEEEMTKVVCAELCLETVTSSALWTVPNTYAGYKFTYKRHFVVDN